MPIRLSRGEPAGDAWLLLHHTCDSATKCEEIAFSEFGLTVQQYLVLRVLKHAKGPVTTIVLSTWLDRNHNSISYIVNRMEKAGYIKRDENIKDRRSSIISITPKGERVYRQTYDTAEMLQKNIMSVLTYEELFSLIKLLYKVRENTFEFRNIKEKVVDVYIPLKKK